jgi:flagellar L-ring protein precursor FlgH
MVMRKLVVLGMMLGVAGAATAGDGSSLFKSGQANPPPVVNSKGEEIASSSACNVANISFIAVQTPKTKQFQVHDIVTIVVNETSQTNAQGENKVSRAAAIQGEIKDWLQLNGNHLHLTPNMNVRAEDPKLSATLNQTIDNAGSAVRQDSFLTKIAAHVVDVKPNGNLLLEAKKFQKIDDEEISMTLTGEVRPADVAADDSVNSQNVAELTVTKMTKGVTRDGTKMGWMERLVNWLNPF